MRGSIIILGFFVVGLLGGVFNIWPNELMNEDLTTYVLYGLLLFVGISIGSDKGAFAILKRMKLKVILVPVAIVVGSLLGSALIALIFSDMKVKEAMAVGAGFGYYSLSSIFISEISGRELGVIALLANVIREILTLLLAPVFISLFGKLAAIAAGGATAMDTTLPVIVKFSGKEFGVIAVFSGLILTVLVPFLVPFILELL
jgi:uncharacterized membrane protein YbjE (DUF340 family)